LNNKQTLFVFLSMRYKPTPRSAGLPPYKVGPVAFGIEVHL